MTMETSAGFFLSPQQKQIWVTAPHGRSQIAVLIHGRFDELRLRSAFGEVVKGNEALRTVFQRQTGMKLPLQSVLDTSEFSWNRVAVGPCSAVVSAQAADLMHGEAQEAMSPDVSLLRSTVFECEDGRSIWVLTAHAAIADARSMQLILAQTLNGCAGENTTPDEDQIRYVQFAQWQNDLLTEDDDAAKDAAKFWERTTQADAAPSIPGEKTGSASDGTSRLKIEIAGDPGALATRIGEEIASSDVILAAWATVVARWSGQARVEIGVALEGREYEELVGLIGAVSKMYPLIASIQGQPTFQEMVAHVHTEVEEISGVQEYYAPEKSFKVGFQHVVLGEPVKIAEANFSPLLIGDSSHECALKLNSQSGPDGLRLELEYNTQMIGEQTVMTIAASLESFLSAAIATPETTVGSLPLISAEQKQTILQEWNVTSVPVASCSLHSLVDSVASSTIALRSGATSVTYGELSVGSNRLARYLGKLGVVRGSVVGLCVSRSAEMMVSVLGILKAGGAYVPLSADQPKARTAQQLDGIDVLVTESGFVGQLPDFAGQMVLFDGADRPWEHEDDSDPKIEVDGEDLAYVIYTSGSTGTPKGVGVRHRNLVNYATHIVRALGLDRERLQYGTVSTLSADLGNTVIYPSLLTGGCLHVLPYDVATDAQRMAAYQSEYGLDVLKIVPSHLSALLEGGGDAVLPKRYLIMGGEALKPSLLARIGGSCEVINHYGPTETTVGSLMLPVKEWSGTGATVPIGRPIANTRVYVLDANRELVPVGVAGELYIGGAGVTAGYVGKAELTAERFIADPFAAGELMYRTGDLVRWLPEGVVEFLGRADDQIKIRGYRVELGEIEAALSAEPGVRQCVVVTRGDGDLHLVAYVVLDRAQATTTETLKQALTRRLPDYMVPTAIVEMQKLPLTSNGKVDKKALPAPEERAAREYRAPVTETQQLVAQIWAEVLKIDKISIDENFFDLGGHSLLATQVISRIRANVDLEIALRTMFEAPVLQDFAAAVDSVKASGSGSATSGSIKRVARQQYREAVQDQ